MESRAGGWKPISRLLALTPSIPWTLCASVVLHPSCLGFGYCRLGMGKQEMDLRCNAVPWVWLKRAVVPKTCVVLSSRLDGHEEDFRPPDASLQRTA